MKTRIGMIVILLGNYTSTTQTNGKRADQNMSKRMKHIKTSMNPCKAMKSTERKTIPREDNKTGFNDTKYDD